LMHPGLKDAVSDFLEQERVGVMAYAEEARAALPYRQV
ncbi:peptidogalycan biosysnthesis protein, partial [Pseudomonas viridiflava]